MAEEKLDTLLFDEFLSRLENYNDPDSKPFPEQDRSKSWDHCFMVFKEQHNKGTIPSIDQVDCLAKELFIILASWGMYRGSSPLVEYDYTIHKDAVRIVFNEEFKNTWTFPDNNDKSIQDHWIAIKSLKNALKKEYRKYKTKGKKSYFPTETLLTKIMIGTSCCSPAFDTEFKKNSGWNSLTQQTYKDIVKRYYEYRDKIPKQYFTGKPPMKIMDEGYWEEKKKEDDTSRVIQS
jgi:hypothetical protein